MHNEDSNQTAKAQVGLNLCSVQMSNGTFSDIVAQLQGRTIKGGLISSVILSLDLKEVTSPVSQWNYHVW